MESKQKQLTDAIGELPLRSIGPAFMGGRIADIAVDPRHNSTWYVAVGSGGVWKTTNAGTTWQPIFDDQRSYSTGCVALDPERPDVVWVGTGEAVSGRHVGWGDGVYRSRNGGRTWQHLGLARSEHIARILIDPRDGDTVYVAAVGPLWSAGGQRGVYKTTDGGASWTAVLEIDGDTGVTSLEFAPDDPDVLYAATYQRRRRVWSFLAGGPGSGIHKSTDGGLTWRQITQGLPDGDMGKIGLAVTAAEPDIVYATIEAGQDDRGFYRSTDRGESWERRNEYLSGGTGPHYYQEIFASPTDSQLVYQVDVFLHVTRDGGKSFAMLESGREKHSDNHAIWIDPDDGAHLLVGTDAGLYETFDDGATFRHFPNLPVSQFYRVAVDNSEPFTNILGGAQDLGTLFGPTRTMHLDGVRNQDWYVPLGSDGYHVAFDPEDPDIAYLETQVGNVMRYDRRTMELQDIQPQAADGEPPERWNWDTPIVVSPHAASRIYVGSQRLWQSEDRGDSWAPISGDLTRDRSRYDLATMGRVHSVDALWDHMAMSLYGSITHISESPVEAGVLYVGTDDGLIQVSRDGGASWRRAADLPDLPRDGFINDVEASQHEAGVVFATADAHKNGDFDPYVFESRDYGTTWRSMRGDLPDGTIVWAIEQDHIEPDLLFLATEFGLYTSLNGGEHWHRFTKDVPTIAFRDVKLQRRDDDLVAASFGRGFYVLDDYSSLRKLSADTLGRPAALFPVRDAWWYVPHQPMQAPGQPTLGSTAFRRPNPDFGALFTYSIGHDLQSAKDRRRDAEKKLDTDGDDVAFPGWDTLWAEHLETDPAAALLVRDETGEPVRLIEAAAKQGIHRATWDLRLAAPDAVETETPAFQAPWETPPRGPLVPPGTYSVELVFLGDGTIDVQDGPVTFTVKPTREWMAGDERVAAEFRLATWHLSRRAAGAAKRIGHAERRIEQLRKALLRTPRADADLRGRVEQAHRGLAECKRRLEGDPVRERLSEAPDFAIRPVLARVTEFHWDTTQPPTKTHRDIVERAGRQFASLSQALDEIVTDELPRIAADIDAAGGPLGSA